MAGIPFSLGYALNAMRRAEDKGFARIALAVTAVEASGAALLLAIALAL